MQLTVPLSSGEQQALASREAADATMIIGVHVSLSILVFSVCMPSSGIAESNLDVHRQMSG